MAGNRDGRARTITGSAMSGRPAPLSSRPAADQHGNGPLQVDVSYGLPRRGLPAATSFRRWAAAALAGGHHTGPATLAIRLVDEAEGRALNHDFRGRDQATNVLSFPAGMPEGLPPGIILPLGDIALCAPVIATEAAGQGKLLRHHYAHLTIHGVLHLLGHDHDNDEAAAAMEALETALLAGLGIPDPYRDRP